MSKKAKTTIKFAPTNNYRAYSLGSCRIGTLGLSKSILSTKAPAKITSPSITFSKISTSTACTALISSSGHLYTCGDTYSGIIARKPNPEDLSTSMFLPSPAQFSPSNSTSPVSQVSMGSNHLLVLLNDKHHSLYASGTFNSDHFSGLTIIPSNPNSPLSASNYKLIETSSSLIPIASTIHPSQKYKFSLISSGNEFSILSQGKNLYSVGVYPTEIDLLTALDSFPENFESIKKSKRLEKLSINIKQVYKHNYAQKWGNIKQIECGADNYYVLWENGEILGYGANFQCQMGVPNSAKGGIIFLKEHYSLFDLQANFIINNKLSENTRKKLKLEKLETLIKKEENKKNEKIFEKLKNLEKIKNGAKKIAAGKEHLLILCENGDVYSCGINTNLSLGRVTEIKSDTYMENDWEFGKVDFEKCYKGAFGKIIDICTGEQNSFFLCENGDVLTCGNPNLGTEERNTQDIRKIGGKKEFGDGMVKEMAAGYESFIALVEEK